MSGSITDTITLHNGVKMPLLGIGTWQVPEERVAEQTVRTALELGYRHVDTAMIYRNERGIGNGVRASGVPRGEIFVTTKVWNDDTRKGFDAVLKAFDASLDRLGMDYVDLYLVHWPVKGKFAEAWRALEQIYATGRAKAIGVSNFMVHHLEELLPAVKIKPMVNQVEFHPRLMQPKLMAMCRKEQIVLESWAPLMQGKAFTISELNDLAGKYKRTVAQIILRWMIQHRIVTIPKSIKRERIEENCRLYDFELSPADMAAIDALDQNERIGADPDNFPF